MKTKRLRIKGMTAREFFYADPRGYHSHQFHGDPVPSLASYTARTCVRWGAGPGACVEPLDHRGPCRDASGATTLTLAELLLR